MSKIVSVSSTDHFVAYKSDWLQPLIDPIVGQLIHEKPRKLIELVEEHGSPLNIVWPHALAANVLAMRQVLNARRVRHQIFYGAKANKSKALVRAAVSAGIGVDVSSIHEFQDARRAGAKAEQLCATGPAKTTAFHEALLLDGALISVDSLEEFAHLESTATRLGAAGKARVLLRYRPIFCDSSRFGMDAVDLLQCLQRLAQIPGLLQFEGFHFHLSGYAFGDRARALAELAPHIEAAREMGLAPRMVDIGGGLPMQYVDPASYAAFLRSHNSASDYRNHKVPVSFYPYGGHLTAAEWLEQLLDSACVDGLSIADYLEQQDLILALEPGRSLVDQAALSIFRITRTKQLANNRTVLFAEGSSFSACETWFNSEFLIDPIHISATCTDSTRCAPTQAYIAGHSCLDDDVITNRLINFSVTPKPGDLLVYVNTAGYQMDLLENEFHRHPLPTRLTAIRSADESIEFSPDY
ncbi:Y4yA family PLP-dependent enzyme [Pseudomonas sp. LFM046]|uniref:Y4yA family PLP-dependent enzyme n=1 Tax=Pseudomonas sp. LFM046 TaxID=1608357 RepID=UPI0005CFE6D6|nr:Y4yA family PLP-dependent enzyme [Pseudomonas sp. LFM046]